MNNIDSKLTGLNETVTIYSRKFGSAFKQLRESNGMSKEELSIMSEVSIHCINRYELGDSIPTTIILNKMIKVIENFKEVK